MVALKLRPRGVERNGAYAVMIDGIVYGERLGSFKAPAYPRVLNSLGR